MLEVYGEYLFLENLLMNWLILYLTGYFSKYKVKKYKIFIGAGMGACYAFIFFFPSLKFMYTFFMKVVFSALMIVITFTPNRFSDFFKLLAIFYLISFMFGGAAFALFYLTDFKGIVSNGIYYIKNFSVKLLIYSGIVAYILIKYCLEYIQTKISRDKVYVPIWIEVDNHQSKLNALIDTGNALSDPLSKYPVIIAEYQSIKDLLPLNIQQAFEKEDAKRFECITDIVQKSNWMSRFRVIPFRSLGRENGMLIGFKPDQVKLEDQKHLRCIQDIIIGVYDKKLSQRGEYTALLHPDLLK